MKPSSFQERIEHQFDFICMRAMDDERKNYFLYLSRLAKREVSFSDIGDYLVNQFATTDSYSSDFQIFTLNIDVVGIIRRNGLGQGDVNEQFSKIVHLIRQKRVEGVIVTNMMSIATDIPDAYYKVGKVKAAGGVIITVDEGMLEMHIKNREED